MKLFCVILLLLFSSASFSQDAWTDKVICGSGSIEIGEDGNFCYSWKAVPADPNLSNPKTAKITVTPSQTTVYTRTAIGQDFSSVTSNDVKVIVVKDVVFSESGSQKYGYDDYTNPSIPWKSVQVGQTDPIGVEITPAGGYDGVYFKIDELSIFKGVNISPVHATADKFDLSIKGVSSGEGNIDANCEKEDGTKIKEFDVKSATLKTRTVAVRLVNATNYNSTDVSDAAIESFLNQKCYNQAILKWTIVRLPAKTVDFDINKDGKIDVDIWMSPEMQIVRDACKDDSYDNNLFLVNNPSDGSTGFMDFNQRYGFIHADVSVNPPSTCAHELGHGGFGLQHTPSDTENIMYNYNSTTKYRLRKNQWDIINP